MLVGYARVSTVEQDTVLQLDALSHAGVKRVYQDKGSGIGPRPNLHRAIASLKPGDTFIVWKLDRIARSLTDLLSIIERVKASGAAIRSLTEPIDTSSAIGELALQMLGAFAQFERRLIRERAIAGQVAAYKRGVRWGGGPPRALNEKQAARACRMRAEGATLKQIADAFGVSQRTISRTVEPGRRAPKNRVEIPVLRQYLTATELRRL